MECKKAKPIIRQVNNEIKKGFSKNEIDDLKNILVPLIQEKREEGMIEISEKALKKLDEKVYRIYLEEDCEGQYLKLKASNISNKKLDDEICTVEGIVFIVNKALLKRSIPISIEFKNIIELKSPIGSLDIYSPR